MAEGATQCGFCTPGMILSAKALLDQDPDPADEEIRRALSGNLCRCTGYAKIIRAVKKAAQAGKEAKHRAAPGGRMNLGRSVMAAKGGRRQAERRDRRKVCERICVPIKMNHE